MYEVEVKAQLHNREEVIEKLQKLGCVFSSEIHQIDHVFIPKALPFPPPKGVPILRVRKQSDKNIFTLKINQSSRQDCIERELEIGDGDMMIDAIKLLGYKEVPRVEKRRIKTTYKDMEIVLDVVERLGEFIEAEKITEEADPEIRKKIQEELFSFLGELGVRKEDHMIDGKYDIMMYEKYGM